MPDMSTSVATLDALPERVRGLAESVAVEARCRFGAELHVYWFGSWVNGKARPHSDIDLALHGEGPLPHVELAAFRDWIDDLPTLYSIDLLDLNIVGERLRGEVERTGVSL